MAEKKKFYTKHPIDYSKHLPNVTPPRAPTQRQLYNLVYSFGTAGCWMSNATIGKILHRSRRSIQIARGKLHVSGAIIVARCNPRTNSMWASRHPAVSNTKILYFKGGKIANPIISQSGAPPSGAQKRRPGGAITAPKRKEYNNPSGYILPAASQSGGRPAAGTLSNLGGQPPEPPGGSGNGEKLSALEMAILERNCAGLTAYEVTIILYERKWKPEKISTALKKLFEE